MDGELIILGCGGSSGVPAIGNWWGNCDSAEPRNVRTRPSIAVQTAETLLIVDTGPDFQAQMNRENMPTPDYIIITHGHSDHVNGLDELRTLQRLKKKKFPLYALGDTLKMLERRLDYMFKNSEDGFYPSVCDAYVIQPGGIITLGDIGFTPFEQDHGSITSLGLRFGNVGYSTDTNRLDDDAVAALQGVDIWIADAAANHSHGNPVHFTIDDVIETNARIGAKKVYLTHLPPTMDYQTLCRELPDGYAPAYDGLRIPLVL